MNTDNHLRRSLSEFYDAMSVTARSAADLVQRPCAPQADVVMRSLAESQIAVARLSAAITTKESR